MADLLLSPQDLQRSLSSSAGFDQGLAEWALEIVSNTARMVTTRDWTADTVPPGVQAIVSMAARRLYTNPDRMTREADGDYSYGLDSSVTNAAVFTPGELGQLQAWHPGRQTGSLRIVSTTRGDGGAPSGRVPDGTEHGFPWYGTSDGNMLWPYPGGAR